MTSWTESFRGKRWLLDFLCCCAVTVSTDRQVEFQCPNLDKGTQEWCLRPYKLSNTILMRVRVLLTKLVKSVDALRAERLIMRLNSLRDVNKGIRLG
jgi:hypothetical protein